MAEPGPLLVIRLRSRARDIERLTRPLFNEELTPQAIAGHKRSARDRIARHRRIWGLLADVVEFTPAPSLDEHRARQRAASILAFRQGRKEWADAWRKARARLRELPRERAAELVAAWNAREWCGRAGPLDLLGFLNEREPTEAILTSRRNGRLASARVHIEVSRRCYSWYIAHRTCPEGELGAADLLSIGTRYILRCIACQAEWRTVKAVAAAEAAGELAKVDFRLAEQLELL